MIQAQFEKTFSGWRKIAREYITQGIAPHEIHWTDQTLSLFIDEVIPTSSKSKIENLKVPPDFIKMAEAVSYAREEDRWNLLYRILYRLQFENPNLMKITVDPDIDRADHLAHSVRRDIHKMHAFVRFKKVTARDEENSEEIYVAWHKPEHLIVQPGTPFFARRFGDKRWSIFTPDESAHWDLKELTFGPGMPQKDFDAKKNWKDDWDEVWKTYYKSIFNPSRIKIKMMKSEMATKYWSSMPETSVINELLREAPKRLQTMAENQNHAAVVPVNLSIAQLREQAQSCTACPLFSKATKTVFGTGPDNAQIMIVGEQPGDQEDLAGLPFVGPSGEILNRALSEAQLNRAEIYLTNAVKHFKWTAQENLRLHQKPSGKEMHACKPWLEAEIFQIKPKVIIALGATAATAVLGRLPKISEERGKIIRGSPFAEAIIISWHPSAILRSQSEAESQERTQHLMQDLQLVRELLS